VVGKQQHHQHVPEHKERNDDFGFGAPRSEDRGDKQDQQNDGVHVTALLRDLVMPNTNWLRLWLMVENRPVCDDYVVEQTRRATQHRRATQQRRATSRGIPRLAVVGGLLAALVLGGCASGNAGGADAPDSSPTPLTADGSAALTQGGSTPVSADVSGVIAENLNAPWSIAFLPDGSALVTERDEATIVRLVAENDSWRAEALRNIDGVDNRGEGGLMGLAVRATDSGQTQVFAYWSTSVDNRVGVMVWDGQSLSEPEVILAGIPHAGIHNGGRIALGPDDALYVATGDAADTSLAQDPNSLAGKILRISPDGDIPADNPRPDSPVYSLGHRNVQGLGFDDEGRLWASEFGASDVDEFNLIEPGGNYGWPIYEGAAGDPDYIDPTVQWEPTAIASPSGLAIAEGWGWVAGLRGQTLWQVPLDPEIRVSSGVAWFEGEFGRLRDAVVAPDGSIWMVTNNTDGRGRPGPQDDRILRVVLTPLASNAATN